MLLGCPPTALPAVLGRYVAKGFCFLEHKLAQVRAAECGADAWPVTGEMNVANWDEKANKQFTAIKAAAHASDAQMQTLKQQIDNWADHLSGADDNTNFPFGQYRNSVV